MPEKEPEKFKIQEILKMLKQEIQNPKTGNFAEACFWYAIFVNGVRKGFWKKQDSLEHVVKVMKSIGESFEERLEYVI